MSNGHRMAVSRDYVAILHISGRGTATKPIQYTEIFFRSKKAKKKKKKKNHLKNFDSNRLQFFDIKVGFEGEYISRTCFLDRINGGNTSKT